MSETPQTQVVLDAGTEASLLSVGQVSYALHPKGVRYSSQSGGLGLAIPKNAKNADAAFLLLQWLTSKAQDKAVCKIGGVPTRTSRAPSRPPARRVSPRAGSAEPSPRRGRWPRGAEARRRGGPRYGTVGSGARTSKESLRWASRSAASTAPGVSPRAKRKPR